MAEKAATLGHRINFTFDFDAMSLWIGSFGATSPGPISQGEFAPIGVDRILKMLAENDVLATFYITGHSALAFPDRVKAIHDAGHEIGHHGFVHERTSLLTPEQERFAMERGMTILEDLTGSRPIGYRSPSGDFTTQTAKLLQEFGITYDSSLQGSDWGPYWLRTGDEYPTDSAYVWGEELPIVEMPWSWTMDDFPHYGYVRGGAGPNAMKTAAQVYDVWWEEFDYFVREVPQGCFNLVMHPDFSGRGPRVEMLSRLIKAMKEHPVTFCTVAEAADAARAVLPAPRPRRG